jgi:hypothetical protein
LRGCFNGTVELRLEALANQKRGMF